MNIAGNQVKVKYKTIYDYGIVFTLGHFIDILF